MPVVLAEARLAGGVVVDADGNAAPLLSAEDPWRLPTLTGGRPTTLFGELEENGFRALSATVAP